ncbi:hydroxycarboxylic acid receptor 2-like [Protopterus annectens]|uniref:hydroxycarboxylic acid receptor 2-like n=1 Tax=Protopterus annectens TaxID=7888 RepID=UPI001CFA6A72|nr:hydroxycarboxylic acid receptor 2-like [Protopterus annectens]
MINISDMYCLTVQTNVSLILAPVLSVEIIIGLAGNGIALWIFFLRMKFWKPSTVYLLCLVVADLLLMISLPFRIDNYFRGEHWIFGDKFCKVNLFMLAMNRTASIVFLTVVAIDRYLKVVHPHHRLNMVSLQAAVIIAITIWLVLVLMNSHVFSTSLLFEYKNHSLCRSYSSYNKLNVAMMWHYGIFFMEVVLPLCVILFCTFNIIAKLHRRKMHTNPKVRRAVAALIIIVLVFIICFVPCFVAGLAAMLIKYKYPNDCEAFTPATEWFHGSLGFTYLNSVLDPLVYCFTNPTFKKACTKALSSLGLWSLESENNEQDSRDSVLKERRATLQLEHNQVNSFK